MSAIRAHAYPRAGVLGNPSDGYGGRVLSLTYSDFQADVELRDEGLSVEELLARFESGGSRGIEQLTDAALSRFNKSYPLPSSTKIDLTARTNIPRQVGMSGSSALIIATLKALAERANISVAPRELALLAWDLEADGDVAARTAFVAALLASLRTKGETAEEVAGLARAMQAEMVRMDGVAEGPPVLDIVGTKHPKRLDGRSFLPLLHGKKQSGREHIIKEYNENAGASRDPMRAIQTKRYLYLFNPWSNGDRVFATATTGTVTFRRMTALASSDKKLAARLDLYKHRVPEELYDVANDPDCLHNLIAHSKHQAALPALQAELEAWMKRTKDPILEVFQKRANGKPLTIFKKH